MRALLGRSCLEMKSGGQGRAMPRGAKPKVYDAGLVENVRALYAKGMTQDEIAELSGVTQKVIWRLMLRHEIPARVAAKRDQRGPRNLAWKGDDASYKALHLRVAVVRGKPSLCERCGTTSAARFEWANLSKKYADPNDYIRLCVSCHHRMDGTASNLGPFSKRKEVLP